MKKRKVILGVISIMTLCLTACGKPNMSFEEAIDTVTHSEISEMMADAEIYEQNFNISSNFSMTEDNVEANVNFSTNSKQNEKDSEWETTISRKINASWDGDEWRETITLDWDAILRYLSNGIYFKLNSLNIDGPEDFNPDELGFDIDWIKGQWFSFEVTEEMLNEIKARLPEDFELNEKYNEENLQKMEEDLQNFEDNLKKAINNDGSLVYNGIYSEFNGYNAYKFSIDKKKVFDATTEYIKTLVPEEYMDDYTEAIEEIDIDEVFEDLPFKNFEWYLVITWKKRVQIVIENIDIEDYYSTTKLNATFGRDKYELAVKEDGEEVFIFTAKLNKAHYDVILKADNQEIIKWTITPRKSHWKLNIDFDLSINFELDEKISIPLKWWWSWEKISKFNVERPTNSKNLLEDIMGNIDLENIDPSVYQSLVGWMEWQAIATPLVAGWILAASLMPRMQSAQNRARDVARKSDLAQIQTAIIVVQSDKWKWPGIDNGATKWLTISNIEKEIKEAWLYSIPTDPIKDNPNHWLGENYRKNVADWEYLYLVAQRNGVENGGFILMAHTEVEWWSNWIVCDWEKNLKNWYIDNNTDIAKIHPCNYIVKGDTCWINKDYCTYTNEDELRYITLY